MSSDSDKLTERVETELDKLEINKETDILQIDLSGLPGGSKRRVYDEYREILDTKGFENVPLVPKSINLEKISVKRVDTNE